MATAVEAQTDRLAAFFEQIADCRDTTDFTHGMHPYPAKFIPHIPRALIDEYSEPGDLIWDPMCGSGTTLVESMVAGRTAIGGDLNPIAALVSRAKTTPLGESDAQEVEDLAADLIAAAANSESLVAALPEFRNRDHWFEPMVSRELAWALGRIDRVSSSTAKDLSRCAFSAIVVSVSNQESETRWSAKPQTTAPARVLTKLAGRLLDSLRQVRRLAAVAGAGHAEVLLEDARKASISTGSVRLIVTSPPYANSHDYYLYNKLRMFWLEHDVRSVQDAEIGSRNRHSDKGEAVESYLDAMSEVFAEMKRALAIGGRAAIVVGDAVIRGEFFDMGDLIVDRGTTAGLTLDRQFNFDHRRFNSTFQRGFGTKARKLTHVLVFEAT